jgi:hypothetical protein
LLGVQLELLLRSFDVCALEGELSSWFARRIRGSTISGLALWVLNNYFIFQKFAFNSLENILMWFFAINIGSFFRNVFLTLNLKHNEIFLFLFLFFVKMRECNVVVKCLFYYLI